MKNNIPKTHLKKSGVYVIRNIITDDIYIGSTNCFVNRYRGHLCTLKKNTSESRILQNAVNKYGIENFEFSILRTTSDFEKFEVAFIELYKPKYNLVKELYTKRVFSEEMLQRMSLSQKGRTPWNKGSTGGSYNRISKHKIKSVDLQGNVLIHEDIHAAVAHFKFGQSSIYSCCLGKRTNVYGIRFSYVNQQL